MTAATLQPGDRVRGVWDLATVLGILDEHRILVQFDAIDATGWRTEAWLHEPTIRLAGTLTKVPNDTPQVEECAASKAAHERQAR